MAVAADKTAVEADIRNLCRRNHFKLSREEVLLDHAVLFVEKLENVKFNELAALVRLERK